MSSWVEVGWKMTAQITKLADFVYDLKVVDRCRYEKTLLTYSIIFQFLNEISDDEDDLVRNGTKWIVSCFHWTRK